MNQLKGRTVDDESWQENSQFDADTDKAGFRQYEDACNRVKSFYKEQHGMCIISLRSCVGADEGVLAEKQTMEFNLNARVKFRKNARARMGMISSCHRIFQVSLFTPGAGQGSGTPCSSSTRLSTTPTPMYVLYAATGFPAVITSTVLMTSATARLTSHRLNTCFRPLKPFAKMASPSGCRLLGWCMILGSCCISLGQSEWFSDYRATRATYSHPCDRGQWDVVGVSQPHYQLLRLVVLTLLSPLGHFRRRMRILG